jgi:hypothetical protein
MAGVCFYGFLWAPCEQWWPQILKSIAEKYQLVKTKKYKFQSHKDLSNMILKLYKHDDVNLDLIKKVKIEALKGYPPRCMHFRFLVNNPEYIPRGNSRADKAVLKLKKSIRKEYKDKVTGYRRDIIIHISDNPGQSNIVDDLITKEIFTI